MTGREKILIVDDDPLVLKTVSRLLSSRGYQASTAQSGRKAIQMVAKHDFDLVLSDIRMPELDGVETVQIIKEHYDHHGKTCAFLFITGYSDDKRTEAAANSGRGKVLLKPFEAEDLLENVKLQLRLTAS